MKTNVASTNSSLFIPANVELISSSVFNAVVFRPGFNHFEKINATQAWSLFFTRGREDKALGLSPKVGRFYNFSLIVLAGMFWTFLYQSKIAG